MYSKNMFVFIDNAMSILWQFIKSEFCYSLFDFVFELMLPVNVGYIYIYIYIYTVFSMGDKPVKYNNDSKYNNNDNL